MARKQQDHFQERMRLTVNERQIMHDLKKSQKECQRLDREKGEAVKAPPAWYWPPVDEIEEELELEPENKKFREITHYLRTTHFYCIWCEKKYRDEKNLMENCPGDTYKAHSEAHDD